MAILTLAEVLEFCGVDADYFKITAGNDVLYLAYDTGSSTAVDIPDATYSGAALATAAQTAMNSALTMSGTVTYSSTTRKFSFGAGANHTLTYTHTGSDAAYTFGFNQAHAAALTITSDDAAGDPTAVLDDLRAAAESYIKKECRREFESTAYSLYRQNGNGRQTLYVMEYPITAFYRLSIGERGAIYVYNTSTYTTASVSVTSTGIVLVKNGTADATVLFATYTTITLVVAAINAIGSGWVATVADSTLASHAATELLEVFGQNCIDSKTVTLYIPDDAVSDFILDPDRGMLHREAGFPAGTQNIIMDYTAGFTTMPDDIKSACLILTKTLYQRWREESFGAESYSIDGMAVRQNDLPDFVKTVIGRYRRRLV